MTTIYLRAEAVNLTNVIEDTEDLSTIRGSGLMILDLDKPIEAAIKSWGLASEYHRVTRGASQAVFCVTLKDDSTAEELVQAVAGDLRKNPQLRYATVVVDWVPAFGYRKPAEAKAEEQSPSEQNHYDLAREALLAKNRWSQLKQARISIAGTYPSEIANVDGDGQQRASWCPVDMVRPAATLVENVRNNEKRLVSESVAARRKHGFEAKQEFYKDVVDWEPKADVIDRMKPAWHFHQIAAFDDRPEFNKDYEHLPPNLNGKIALFYLDGNHFGRKQADKCVSEAAQKQWDDLVQGQKKAALKTVLDQAWDPKQPDQTGPGWWNKASEREWRVRLETLLWGGDELLWVVPAWQGWNVAQTFFKTVDPLQNQTKPPIPALRPGFVPPPREMRNLDVRPSKKTLAKAGDENAHRPIDFGTLTYSAGLVFCHANAPIHRVSKLAKELAQEAKEAYEHTTNAIAYTVLESFDQLGTSVKAARRQHLPFPPTVDEAALTQQLQRTVIRASDLPDLIDHVVWMRDNFPRGAVYKLLRILRNEATTEATDSQFSRWFTRATAEIADRQMNTHLSAFDLGPTGNPKKSLEHRMRWLHLAELWDYVV